MIRSEISEPMGSKGIWDKSAVAESDVLLARLFLISILLAGPASYFLGLSPESVALFPCPFHLVSGIECPGCGMTRACIALGRGDLGQALHYNPLSIGLVLFAAAFALAPNRIRVHWRDLAPGIRRIMKWTALFAVLVFWICRILP